MEAVRIKVTICTYERERGIISSHGWFYNSYSASDTCYIFSVISGGCQWPHDNIVTSSWHRVTARMWPDFLIIKNIWWRFSPWSESCAALHTPGAWCWPVSEQTIGDRNIWPGDSSDGNDPVLAHAEGHRCPAPASPATADTCHWCQQQHWPETQWGSPVPHMEQVRLPEPVSPPPGLHRADATQWPWWSFHVERGLKLTTGEAGAGL